MIIQKVARNNNATTLALQTQMGDQNKSLDETDAGQELRSEIIKERKRFEKHLAEVKVQMQEALQARDEDSIKMLKESHDEYTSRINQLEQERVNLKTNLENLHDSRYRKLERQLEKMERREEEREERRRERQERASQEPNCTVC